MVKDALRTKSKIPVQWMLKTLRERMSLTSNIKNKTEIGTFLLDLVVAPTFENLPKTPVIKHMYRRWSLIGTAFDYLVRMIISKQMKVDFEPKIAELAIEYYLEQQELEDCIEPINRDSGKLSTDMTETNISDICRCKICTTKRSFYQSKTGAMESISGNDLFSMAKHSLQFARLDVYVRARLWDSGWQSYKSDDDDATELVHLAKLWRESFVMPDGDLDMNPVMPFAGLVGGADADIVSGRNVIDWKVVNDPKRDLGKNIAQMIGYALLLNLEEEKITTCHLYFARHGYHYVAEFEDLMKISMSEAVKEFKKLTNF